MGFGTLFIGYFLLLNITYFVITDVISALIMALGLYKLQTVNRYFKGGFYISLGFAAIGLSELCGVIIEMFYTQFNSSVLISYTAIPRYTIIAVLCMMILLGIEDVAAEVGLANLSKKSRRLLIPTIILYIFAATLEIPGLDTVFDIKILAVLSIVCLAGIFAITAINLMNIYSAYMKICISDDNEYKETPSKFGFVNKYREHTAKKQQEYAEYKMEKMKNKNSKKKRK